MAASVRDRVERRSRGRRARELPGLAGDYLSSRGDTALGLAPTWLLDAREAEAWVLFWAAARYVDDSIEEGRSLPEDWLEAIETREASTFAGRCVEAFLRHPAWSHRSLRLEPLLRRGLKGLEDERKFDRPRSLADYLRLIEKKSASAMIILDHLLFPDESSTVLRRHASLFAASTQLGDDCRDVRRDLGRGRVFVTREELDGDGQDLRRWASDQRFWMQRQVLSRRFLEAARGQARRLGSEGATRKADALSRLWEYALDTGQIRPTTRHLRLKATSPARRSREGPEPLPKPLEHAIREHFERFI